jgi:Reverse transcriptase (RNA-dependent DNA polymerase)
LGLLDIHTTGQLAHLLETTEHDILCTLKRVNSLCDKITITDLDKPSKKPRVVYDPRGPLRRLQKTLYAKILLPGLERSRDSHGGVKGKNILTCIAPHTTRRFVYSGDIQNFYPSIRYERVKQLFLDLRCSAEVAKMLTRLCTNHYRLEQGFITSPILADQIFRPADQMIVKLCEVHGMKYGRFVDDLILSSPFNLERSGIPKTISKILAGSGFAMNAKKNTFGSTSKGAVMLGLLLRNRKPNVLPGYLEETICRLNKMIVLGDGGEFAGPYYSRHELYGRLQYVCWVNKARKHEIATLWRRADWKRIEAEADKRGIAKRRDRLSMKREKRP